ncbi:molybdate-anion transporter-like [Watersipora subatra]|uniref:molybdate-anion transporter-like n=1 Tax=Watersipora subatra TaxID=2589382 RepID=UPI00355C414B
MMVITYIAFLILSVCCAALTTYVWKSRKASTVINNPNFTKFQRQYFSAYFLALIADWLQGPYLYRLYRYYGFEQAQIAVLYVVGYASTVILGTWAPFVANKYGRRNLCVVFTVIYSIACFMKLSTSYGLLLLGRMFGGVATSLLFSAYEAWYIHEHIETHDLPKEWIVETMKKLSVWNGSLAVLSGVIANAFAEWLDLGPVAPFMLAIPCLLISGIIIMTTWSENYGTQNLKFKSACLSGLREINESRKIMLIGAIQSMFESVMALIVFLWTPVLWPGHPSLGVVFSSFMVCIMIGTSLHELLTRYHTESLALALSITMAFISCCICVIFTHPDYTNTRICFISFLLYQISVGIYFASISAIREEIIPENHAVSIMNWFRVPLNIISCIVLMLLHDETFRHGNRLIFIICCALLFCALICLSGLMPLIQKPEPKDKEAPPETA